MWPTQACAMSMMRLLMPPEFISSPARMKNGTASSGKLSMPATRFCASSWVSQKPSTQAMPAPVSTRASAMFMPMPMSTSMPAEKTTKASASGDIRSLHFGRVAQVQRLALDQFDDGHHADGDGAQQGRQRQQRRRIAQHHRKAGHAGQHLQP